MAELTSSSARRISAQLLVNSHTSRNSVSAASANFSSSNGVLRLNRRTTSPPYLARSFAGSWDDGREALSTRGRSTLGGRPKTFSTAVSRNQATCGKTLRRLHDCGSSTTTGEVHGAARDWSGAVTRSRRNRGGRVSGEGIGEGRIVEDQSRRCDPGFVVCTTWTGRYQIEEVIS